MPSLLNSDLFSSMMKEKRGAKGLRAAAEEIGGISAATLSRIEQGNLPDVDSFIRICKWLNVATDTFIISSSDDPQSELSVKDIVVSRLRADKTLPPETAKTLIDVITHFYEARR